MFQKSLPQNSQLFSPSTCKDKPTIQVLLTKTIQLQSCRIFWGAALSSSQYHQITSKKKPSRLLTAQNLVRRPNRVSSKSHSCRRPRSLAPNTIFPKHWRPRPTLVHRFSELPTQGFGSARDGTEASKDPRCRSWRLAA